MTEEYGFQDYCFNWNKDKNLSNIRKHGLSFKEAASAFLDPYATIIDDIEHSQDEERYILVGMSKKLNLLMVCHCYRDDDEIICIISARAATKKEQKLYGGARHD